MNDVDQRTLLRMSSIMSISLDPKALATMPLNSFVRLSHVTHSRRGLVTDRSGPINSGSKPLLQIAFILHYPHLDPYKSEGNDMKDVFS